MQRSKVTTDHLIAPPSMNAVGALQMSEFAFFNEVKESKHEEPLFISKGFLFPPTSILRTLPHLKGTVPRHSKHTRKQNTAA